MDILNHGLKGVETPGLGDRDLGAKIGDQVLEHNTIASGEKGEDVLDKVFFVGGETFPISLISAKINLLRGPGHLLVLFIGIPDLWILDGIEAISLIILAEDVFDGGGGLGMIHGVSIYSPFLKKIFQKIYFSILKKKKIKAPRSFI
jgi:hypothetical protein